MKMSFIFPNNVLLHEKVVIYSYSIYYFFHATNSVQFLMVVSLIDGSSQARLRSKKAKIKFVKEEHLKRIPAAVKSQ